MKLEILNRINNGISKQNLAAISNDIVAEILETGDPIAKIEYLTAIESIVESVKKNNNLKKYTMEELEKQGKGYTTSNGTKFELAETGFKYDYSQCNDTELLTLQAAAESAANALKARQDFLKCVPESGLELTNSETGELYVVRRPSKSSTSSFKITLSK
jgi:hypothetical protein